jgi:hypothetical protein
VIFELIAPPGKISAGLEFRYRCHFCGVGLPGGEDQHEMLVLNQAADILSLVDQCGRVERL